MTDNASFRHRILDRLGYPEPELPGVMFITRATPASQELCELFDEMCMVDVHDEAVFERALDVLESVRARDYQAFYAGRSELLAMYPVIRDIPESDPEPAYTGVCLSLARLG